MCELEFEEWNEETESWEKIDSDDFETSSATEEELLEDSGEKKKKKEWKVGQTFSEEEIREQLSKGEIQIIQDYFQCSLCGEIVEKDQWEKHKEVCERGHRLSKKLSPESKEELSRISEDALKSEPYKKLLLREMLSMIEKRDPPIREKDIQEIKKKAERILLEKAFKKSVDVPQPVELSSKEKLFVVLAEADLKRLEIMDRDIEGLDTNGKPRCPVCMTYEFDILDQFGNTKKKQTVLNHLEKFHKEGYAFYKRIKGLQPDREGYYERWYEYYKKKPKCKPNEIYDFARRRCIPIETKEKLAIESLSLSEERSTDALAKVFAKELSKKLSRSKPKKKIGVRKSKVPNSVTVGS